MPRQLPIDLAPRQALTRDDLVVTAANRQAVALIDGWPAWPAPVVLLVGPAGCGKTHLATIWRDRAEAASLAPESIGTDEIERAQHNPVLIDDADRVADEKQLFHLLNASRAAGQLILMTARRPAVSWGVKLPDLLSRLKAASRVDIGPPDDLLLSGVITKLFADRQVEVEPHVVRFLVLRMERSLSAAITLVGQLDRAALERKSRITRALAAVVVGAPEGEGQKRGDENHQAD